MSETKKVISDEAVEAECPNCARPASEATWHCSHPKCDHVECLCARIYSVEKPRIGGQ